MNVWPFPDVSMAAAPTKDWNVCVKRVGWVHCVTVQFANMVTCQRSGSQLRNSNVRRMQSGTWLLHRRSWPPGRVSVSAWMVGTQLRRVRQVSRMSQWGQLHFALGMRLSRGSQVAILQPKPKVAVQHVNERFQETYSCIFYNAIMTSKEFGKVDVAELAFTDTTFCLPTFTMKCLRPALRWTESFVSCAVIVGYFGVRVMTSLQTQDIMKSERTSVSDWT